MFLRIFIDSANIEEIKEINGMGFLAGVTTNPSLVAKEKNDYKGLIRRDFHARGGAEMGRKIPEHDYPST